MPCTPDDAAALQALMALTIPQRIVAVRADVKSRADRFAWLEAHDLAEVLGIDDSRSPGNDWERETRADDLTLEEYADGVSPPSSLLDWLTPTARRAKTLAKKAEKLDSGEISDFGFLTDEERETIQEACDADMLESNLMNGMGCYATILLGEDRREHLEEEPERNPGESDEDYLLRKLEVEEDDRLLFEAFIEDDGSSFQLKTPYELRDEDPDRPALISKRHW